MRTNAYYNKPCPIKSENLEDFFNSVVDMPVEIPRHEIQEKSLSQIGFEFGVATMQGFRFPAMES